MLSTVWIKRSGPPSHERRVDLGHAVPGDLDPRVARDADERRLVLVGVDRQRRGASRRASARRRLPGAPRCRRPAARSARLPVSDGANPACALPITSPACADAGATAPSEPNAEPATHATNAVTAISVRRRTFMRCSPTGVALGDGAASTSLLRNTLNDTTRHSPSTCWNTYWPRLVMRTSSPSLPVPTASNRVIATTEKALLLLIEQHLRLQRALLREGSARTRHLRRRPRSASRSVPGPRCSPRSRTAPTRCRRSPRASCRDPGTRRCTARPSASVTSSAATSASACSSACFTSLRVATGVTFVTSNANSGVGGFGLLPDAGDDAARVPTEQHEAQHHSRDHNHPTDDEVRGLDAGRRGCVSTV